ncbi:MAG: adenylyl-sulfate kinase [Planctomycetota bacterium]
MTASSSARPVTSATARSCTTSASRCPTSRARSAERLATLPPTEHNHSQSHSIMSDKGFVLWFTGLSGAGKSTLAEYLTPILMERGKNVEVLDGDVVRTNLSKGLGFSKEDRDTNVARIGFVANLLARNGCCAITAAISPYQEIRDECRGMIDPNRAEFVEVFVEAPLEVVEERDTKGLYKKARAGEIKNFTGVSDPYEAPTNAEVTVHTGDESIEQSADKILAFLEQKGLIKAAAAQA